MCRYYSEVRFEGLNIYFLLDVEIDSLISLGEKRSVWF